MQQFFFVLWTENALLQSMEYKVIQMVSSDAFSITIATFSVLQILVSIAVVHISGICLSATGTMQIPIQSIVVFSSSMSLFGCILPHVLLCFLEIFFRNDCRHAVGNLDVLCFLFVRISPALRIF